MLQPAPLLSSFPSLFPPLFWTQRQPRKRSLQLQKTSLFTPIVGRSLLPFPFSLPPRRKRMRLCRVHYDPLSSPSFFPLQTKKKKIKGTITHRPGPICFLFFSPFLSPLFPFSLLLMLGMLSIKSAGTRHNRGKIYNHSDLRRFFPHFLFSFLCEPGHELYFYTQMMIATALIAETPSLFSFFPLSSFPLSLFHKVIEALLIASD